MSDLFSRLAQRARAAGGGGLRVHAEIEPQHGLIDDEDEDVGGEPVAAAEPGWTEPVAPTVTPRASFSAIDSERPETERPRPFEVVTRELRLMPMPLVVPPSADAESFASGVQPVASSPTAGRVVATGTPRPVPVSRPRVERVERERAVVRDAVLVPAPLAPERKPVMTSGQESAAQSRPPIEVTVGRIEVRVRPPAPTRPDRDQRSIAPPAALTLEEYLRRREASS